MDQPRALIETYCEHFTKARSVNQTSNGYVSKVPTATEPTGDAGTATGASVIQIATDQQGPAGKNSVLIAPYAIAADNGTFSMRVIGWRVVGDGTTPDTSLWIPVVLAEFLCTVSATCPGVAGKSVLNTELFADTISLVGTIGNPNLLDIVSPAANIIGHLVMDMKGFQKLELSFTTGGSATSCNALIARL